VREQVRKPGFVPEDATREEAQKKIRDKCEIFQKLAEEGELQVK
jgi:hypothetical protein